MPISDDLKCLDHRNTRGHHGRKLTAEYRDIFVGDLASAPEHGALGLDARSGDSLPAQIGAQRRFIRGQRLTPYLMAALVLAFPVELGVFFTCGCGYGHKSVLR